MTKTIAYGIRALLLAATALGSAATAQAQAYPNKPIRLVVPFAPGGATDVLARLLADKMAPRLGQAIVVDNKAGAAGIVGTDAVAKSAPDGYTVLIGLSNSLATNQFLFAKLAYDPRKDLQLVTQIATAPLLLIANPSVPAGNAQELVAWLVKNKGKVSYGSYGVGAYPHLAGAHMSEALNADMSHVPYKGEAPMVQDLLAGQIQLAYASALVAKPHIEAGKLKVLGVTGDHRITAMPQVPTLLEQGLKDETYKLTGWLAIAVPAGTPKPVVQKLYEEVKAACDQAEVRNRIAAMGFEVKALSPEAFQTAYNKELPVWERLVKQSGAKLD